MPLQQPPETVVANIRSVAEMQAALERRRTLANRIADLIGSFSAA